MGLVPATSGLANAFGVVELTLFGYASTTWLKPIHWTTYGGFGTSSGNQGMSHGGALWQSTAAVTRIAVYGDTQPILLAGSQLRIYGRL